MLQFYIAGPYLVVAAGNYNNSNAQLISMYKSTTGCEVLPSISVLGAIGGLVNNRLVICGGYDGEYHSACYIYNTTDHGWTLFSNLTTPRAWHASAELRSGSLFITGNQYF